MNKVEMIKVVCEKLSDSGVKVTQKDMGTYVDAIIDTIVDTVASGEAVKLSGFGSFEITERAAREGRNPATGEAIHIEASKSPKFRAASAFKAAVKED